ncbi:hypothetical protein F5883DRAFT_477176 [Diaporthe sp. PMI_573]|nr:hypothetical protein F5883DRAFT_477176 [Diaporthaceae sp. PMI_573]
MPPRKRKAPPVTPAEIPNDLSSQDYHKALIDHFSSPQNSTATFGGSIALEDVARLLKGGEDPPSQAGGPVNNANIGKKKSKEKRKSTPAPAMMAVVDPRPIVIRWDRTDGSAAKLKFPIKDHTETFEDLVRDCESAASGSQGQDVDDASVSKASAMDDSRFSTNLCPYKLGIMPRIEQLLLPNIADIGRGGVNDGGSVVAKIAKIIVYKGAPGSLKSDSEPSSGKAPFGSLVLCLPSPYEGGKLTVSHPEGYKTYDWETTQETEALYWAAFSSGYEAIVSGEVVMLEYKLYYEPRACSEEDSLSGLCCGTAPVNISSLTSYDILQNLLAGSQWMPKGGKLGIYCVHAYPTTISKVPEIKRGSRINYEAGHHEDENPPESETLPSDKINALKGIDLSTFAALRHLNLDVRLTPVVPAPPKTSTFKWYEGDHFPLEITGGENGTVMISRAAHDNAEELAERLGDKLHDVEWVNEPCWRRLAWMHYIYGDKAEPPDVVFCRMALIATIPPAADRFRKTKKRRR